MKIYHVAALSENHVIGRKGKIPWQIREDLRRFKEITVGHAVIMGRLTFESMGKYAPLPNRRNIILTSSSSLTRDGFTLCNKRDGIKNVSRTKGHLTELAIANEIGEAISLCEDAHEVYIIGGGGIYEETLDITDELRLTLVHKEVKDGDTFYPEIDDDTWAASCVEPHETHTYIDYVRRDVRG